MAKIDRSNQNSSGFHMKTQEIIWGKADLFTPDQLYFFNSFHQQLNVWLSGGYIYVWNVLVPLLGFFQFFTAFKPANGRVFP